MASNRSVVGVSGVMLCAGMLSACAAFTPPYSIRELKKNTDYVVNYDATRRGVFISVDGQGQAFACSEPVPDVAVGVSAKASGSVAGKVSGSAEADVTPTQLDGRNPAVLLVRDEFFRVCEGVRDHTISAQNGAIMMNNIINNSEALMLAIAANAAAGKSGQGPSVSFAPRSEPMLGASPPPPGRGAPGASAMDALDAEAAPIEPPRAQPRSAGGGYGEAVAALHQVPEPLKAQ